MSFHTVVQPGYYILYQNHAINSQEPIHYFCGPQHLKGALCPNCQKPLLQFLILDVSDQRLSFLKMHAGTLPLLFCWNCPIAQDMLFYRVINTDTIDILQYKKGGGETDFPYSDYPEYFPGSIAVLDQIPDEIQGILSGLNCGDIDEYEILQHAPSLCTPQHQLGGEPYLVQPEIPPIHCPQCHRLMPFLCSIGDNCLDPRGFTGNEFTQVLFFYCASCSVVGAFQQCD